MELNLSADQEMIRAIQSSILWFANEGFRAQDVLEHMMTLRPNRRVVKKLGLTMDDLRVKIESQLAYLAENGMIDTVYKRSGIYALY